MISPPVTAWIIKLVLLYIMIIYVLQGLYSRITFRQDLYLGGYRNLSLIGPRTGMRWGFVGCVRNLEINNRKYDMRKGAFVGDAIGGVDVGRWLF